MTKIKTLRPQTQEELDARLQLPSEIFRISAKKRFDALNKEYTYKKGTEELFPFKGNYQLSNCLMNYLTNNNFLSKKKKINVLDIGAAGEALTSIFITNTLLKNHFSKIKLHLVDVSKEALLATKNNTSNYPEKILSEYNISKETLNKIKKYLKNAEIYISSATKLPSKIKNIDIVVSGFTHHHMNLKDKKKSCQEMLRVAKKGGFIGISDEQLSLKEYQKWYDSHSNEINERGEPVPIAMESFIEMNRHISFFENQLTNIITFPKNEYQKFHYTFSGIKK